MITNPLIASFAFGHFQWFRLIIENRPHEHNDNIRGLVDINDVRNGFFATRTIHAAFDGRVAAILKVSAKSITLYYFSDTHTQTPNRILDVGDIPPHPNRQLADDIAYPVNGRYTVQWLTPPSAMMQQLLPDNADATFGRRIRSNRPSDLLLHYNYGAAAVKLWGRNADMIEDLAKSPPKPNPVLSGPSTKVHDRKPVIRKRKKAQAAAAKAKKQQTSEGSKRDITWDEDDIMLFFWGNSRVATNRYIEKREAKKKNFEQWRQGVESAL